MSRYKFPHEHGYDKAAVVVAAIVEDICTVVRNYCDHAGNWVAADRRRRDKHAADLVNGPSGPTWSGCEERGGRSRLGCDDVGVVHEPV